MDMQADQLWREDDTIRADKVFVGTARDHDTLEELGVVVIALTVKTKARPLQVSALIPAWQAMEVADAIHAAVRDIELAQ